MVGKHTAEELEKHNLCADFIPKIETGEGFATEWREHFSHSDNDENVCLFSAKEASQEVIDILPGCCHLHKIAAYENIEIPVEKEIWQSTEETEVAAVFTSASNVKRFFWALPKNVSVKTAYSIGPMTTQALQEEEVGTVVQAEACSYDAIVEKILDNRKRKPQNYPIS